MPSQSFLTSRKIGEKAQDIIAAKLKSKGFSVDVVKSGYRPHFDLTAKRGDIRFTAEVKRDQLTQNTGNVRIDLNALSHSKAGILFYMIDPDKFFIAELDKMLAYAKDYPIKKQVGEFKEPSALVAFDHFIRLPFVKAF